MFKSQKKRVILITIYIILFCSRVCNAQNNTDSVKVTYIANTGFLISTSDKRILIDAMFKTGLGYYLEPSTEIQENMVNVTEPFDNIDLILNTHSHADHFDAEMTANHLANNSKGIFIAPQQTVDMLKARDDYNDINSKVQEINLELGSYTENEFNGIEIKIFRIRHSPYYENGIDRHVNVQNLAYLINLNGLKFLHFGDASTQFHENYIQDFQLDQENIDFLFIVYFSCIDSTINIINQYIKPNYIIATHIPPSEFDMITDTFKNVFPNAIFFENSMDSKSFESNISVNSKDIPIPDHVEIEQNYPNPFNLSTVIKYSISKPCFVELKIYDVFGEEINSLINENKVEGEYDINWIVKGLPNGIYFYRLQLDKYVNRTKKMLIF